MQQLIAQCRRLLAWPSAGVALALAATLAWVQPAHGQDSGWQEPAALDSSQWVVPQDELPAETGFRAYPLRELEPHAARRQVAQALGEARGVEIIVDAERNRLLVRGDRRVHEFVGALLAKLDHSTNGDIAEAGSPEVSAEPELGSYALTPNTRDVILSWQRRATNKKDVRVAIDERTSQALVLAPPDVHAQLQAELLRAESASTDSSSTQQDASVPRPEPPTPTSFQLQNLQPQDVHARLERLLSRPLPTTWDASGQWQSFTLDSPSGEEVAVAINGRSHEVRLHGQPVGTAAWRDVIEALDNPPQSPGTITQLVATKPASNLLVRQALRVLDTRHADPSETASLTSMMQPRRDAAEESRAMPPGSAALRLAQAEPPAAETAPPSGASQRPGATDLDTGALLGPVQIEFIEGLDVIVIRGSERDVRRVMEIINQIEELSAVAVPAVEIYPLQHANSEAMAALLTRLYVQVLSQKVGEVSVTPLVKPNALLLIGRPENVRMAMEIVRRLDQPTSPTTRFEVFRLKYAGAAQAKTLVDSFLAREEEGAEEAVPTLAPRAIVVADARTNSLVVSAGPRDMAEIASLVARIDTPSGAAVDQVRIFPLKNSVATDLAEVLRAAIAAQAAETPGEGSSPEGGRVSALEFTTIDANAEQTFKSGVLTGVRVTADARANALVVTAPAQSMNLIAALIAQLDQAPDVVAELKVFTIANGDAVSLTEMLRALFGAGEEGEAAGAAGEGGLVRMTFSYDQRTNSIIAAGSREDLAVVEAILLRLDQGDIRERKTTVYRLKNAFAQNVSEALNNWLQTRRTAEEEAELAISPFEQIEREVIIVPELASNSLIVSATPRYYDEVSRLIDELDERPPMVMIQVLIAEVRLNDTDEFGVELGLQDSLLFDRSLLGDLTTITTTTQDQGPGGAVLTTTEQTIVNAPGQPGFNFNNQTLGNNLATSALSTASSVATQGLSNFSMGRVNGDLGFGGFVFSASSNSVSVLLRALQEKRRLEVLSRPQIMALDGQFGYVQVGQRVPTIQDTSLTQFGQVNSIQYEPVGIILQVQPRISPDGLVVMTIQAIKSEVGPEAEGIPISISATGDVLRAPRIDNTEALTTVSALSGQTVVLSGLLTTRKQDVHRRVPLLGDIPLIGDLFRYDLVAEQRNELLIILTPRIVYNKLDAEIIKQVESSRMSWVLADVISLQGEVGLRDRCDEWCDGETEAVYPTYIPGEGELGPYPPGETLPFEGPVFQSPAPLPEPRRSPSSGNPNEQLLPPMTQQQDDASRPVTPTNFEQPSRALRSQPNY